MYVGCFYWPWQFIEHADQFHCFIFLLLLSHSLHWIRLLLLYDSCYWVDPGENMKKKKEMSKWLKIPAFTTMQLMSSVDYFSIFLILTLPCTPPFVIRHPHKYPHVNCFVVTLCVPHAVIITWTWTKRNDCKLLLTRAGTGSSQGLQFHLCF